MTTCSGESCSFGLQSVSFVNVHSLCMCVFLFWVLGGVWDWVVLIPDHTLSIYLGFLGLHRRPMTMVFHLTYCWKNLSIYYSIFIIAFISFFYN